MFSNETWTVWSASLSLHPVGTSTSAGSRDALLVVVVEGLRARPRRTCEFTDVQHGIGIVSPLARELNVPGLSRPDIARCGGVPEYGIEPEIVGVENTRIGFVPCSFQAVTVMYPGRRIFSVR